MSHMTSVRYQSRVRSRTRLEKRMITRRTSARLGVVGGTAAALLGVLAAPQASAATRETFVVYTGWNTFLSGLTQPYAANCGDVANGPVSVDDGHGDLVASVDSFSMSCDQRVGVTPNAMPWIFTVTDGGSYFTIKGVDVNVT